MNSGYPDEQTISMILSPLHPGERPPRLHINRERITVQAGNAVYTELITIMNEGGGVLRGSARSDTDWIRLPCQNIETPFINPFRLEIDPRKVPSDPSKGTVTIITNGGTAKIIAEFVAHPEPKPVLSLDNKEIRLCNLTRGDDITTHLMVRNNGSGVLSGTIDSESDWIEVKTRTIWAHTLQVVQIVVHTAAAPKVSQPVGRVRIRSSGGSLEVLVALHFRTGAAPKLRLDPPRIRCVSTKKGIIEEQLTIHNEGEGILRGTIPSPVPWIKIIPSIFPVEKKTRIRISIDTRNLPEGTLSIQIPVITNAGRDTLTVDVSAKKNPQAVSPPRRSRSVSRIVARRRLIAYDLAGRMYTLISSGKSGGEGEIYLPSGIGTQCAKIFHPHRRTGDTDEKLTVMVNNPLPPGLAGMVTWPEILLYDRPGGGRVIGYLMRRIPEDTFRPAHLWYDEQQDADGEGILPITVALTLSQVIEGIHRSGHTIGDLRENNLLINKTGDIVLIDTDSFQIRDPNSGKVFWSRVGTAEYLPPEHLDGSFALDGCDRRYGDHFALAVLIFRFLMNGVHPFQAKGPLVRDAPATSDKILLGYFAFESRLCGIGPPDYAPPYKQVPSQVRSLFREAFMTGHRFPKNRPDAGRWSRVLRALVPASEKTKMQMSISGLQRVQRSEIRQRLLTEPSGREILLKRPLFRIGTGMLRETADEEVLIYLLQTPISGSAMPSFDLVSGIPPSVITPTGPVIRGDSACVGWLVPFKNRKQYLPWHMMADPESRTGSGRRDFSFRHRIACCRNFISALISINNLGLPSPVFSLRSVFIGPDASVRLFSLPLTGTPGSGSYEMFGSNPAVLIFQMLMDGYHPYHGISIAGGSDSPDCMRAGLFSWRGSEPAATSKGRALSLVRIPVEIRELFQEEFSEKCHVNAVFDPEKLRRWYDTFDRILKDLVPCASDPDHWYSSGLSGCPWCAGFRMPGEIISRKVLLLLCAPERVTGLLSTPRIAGLFALPVRCRRRIRIYTDSSPRWRVIPLPAERVNCLLLPISSPQDLLPLIVKRNLLPVLWQKAWMVCIPLTETAIQVQDRNWQPLQRTVETPLIDQLVSRYPSLSLIDEMILTSTMDRLKGEGVRGRRSKRRQVQRYCKPRKIPVEIMLYPIYLPRDEETNLRMNHEEGAHQNRKKPTKKRSGRGLQKKIQKLLLDFIG